METHNTARFTTSHHGQVLFALFCFLLLLLIKVSIKHVVASAHAQLFPVVITVGNMFPLVITVGNTFPLIIIIENTFPSLITVGKNNGSSFFLKKRGTFEMSSMGHRTSKTGENFNLAKIFLNMRVRLYKKDCIDHIK